MKVRVRDMLLMLIDMATVYLVFNICYHFCLVNYTVADALYTEALGALIPIYFICLLVFGTYSSIWRYAAAKEYLICNFAAFTSGIVYYFVSRFAFRDYLPYSFYISLTFSIAVALVFTRLVYRVYRDFVNGGDFSLVNVNNSSKKKRVLIVGCGTACYSMLDELKVMKDPLYLPVVGIDDNPNKIGKTFNGLKIVGTTDYIETAVKKYKIDEILIAIPSANNEERGRLIDKCSKANAEVRILPQLFDFNTEDKNFLQKLRDITPDELLGRETVKITNEEVLSFICGKTVLVTGGGGSIGSELSRQIAANSPKKLIIVDIYENNAYDIEQELRRKYKNDLDLEVIVSSVRDYARINHIIRKYKPDLIIHAAAHKHVPLMETAPAEAVKNNIFGTVNVATAAAANNVPRFIMISTDKAVNPTNIMGATKRVCEMIIQSMDAESENTSFSCVRFGNVLGSNGSVIPLFKKQIAEGGPVTVTHPDIIRYFMTIPEAVQLVLVTGAMAKGGEIFVLDMGKPVKILDLAKKMISLAGKKTEIKFVGLRPGEKLFEELLMDEEGMRSTENKKIYIGKPIDMDADKLKNQLDDLWNLVNDNDISDEEMMSQLEVMLYDITSTFKRADAEETVVAN